MENQEAFFYKECRTCRGCPRTLLSMTKSCAPLSDGYGTYFITVIDANGKELGQYGGPGLGDEHTHGPHGLGLVNGEISYENKPGEMHRYTLDGKHIGKWQHPDLKMPRHITHINGNLLTPDLAGNLSLWTPAGDHITTLGQSPFDVIGMFDNRAKPITELPTGCFVAPHDVAVDADGCLYVAEWLTMVG